MVKDRDTYFFKNLFHWGSGTSRMVTFENRNNFGKRMVKDGGYLFFKNLFH